MRKSAYEVPFRHFLCISIPWRWPPLFWPTTTRCHRNIITVRHINFLCTFFTYVLIYSVTFWDSSLQVCFLLLMLGLVGDTWEIGFPGGQGQIGQPGDRGDCGQSGDIGPSGPALRKGSNGSLGQPRQPWPRDLVVTPGDPGNPGQQGFPGPPGGQGAPGAKDVTGPGGVKVSLVRKITPVSQALLERRAVEVRLEQLKLLGSLETMMSLVLEDLLAIKVCVSST